MNLARIPASQVLVTIGTGFGASPCGLPETQRARMIGDPNMIGFAAFDARLVDIDLAKSTAANPVFVRRTDEAGGGKGSIIPISEIESRWGGGLRQEMGIRFLKSPLMAAHVPTDIGAPLAFNLENLTGEGTLRERLGLRFTDFEGSPLEPMRDNFMEDEFGPSLQALLFLAGAGCLSALPKPLSEMSPQAFRFQVAAATAFPGQDAEEALRHHRADDPQTRRLASTLSSHGPALVTRALSPSYPIKQTLINVLRARREGRNYLDRLRAPDDQYNRYNIPRVPIVVNGACASAFIALGALAMKLQRSERSDGIDIGLWLAADAVLTPHAHILEGFGEGAMISRANLAKSGREVGDSLAPYDVDSCGTAAGNGGYGIVVTTLEYALRHFLDITGIITGWGNSCETGGNNHSAGVGFGGDNSTRGALIMSYEDHGVGVERYTYRFAHATGTPTNSKTDAAGFEEVRRDQAEVQGFRDTLPRVAFGAAKPDLGHEMAVAGSRAAEAGVHYLTGRRAPGIRTLRRPNPEVAAQLAAFDISSTPVDGNEEGGMVADVQGYGGYNASLAMIGATNANLRGYRLSDSRSLDAWGERRREIRRECIEREARARREIGSVRRLLEKHRWPEA